MSKPPLRAVLPRSHVRARARTLYTGPFTSLHQAHLDAGLLSSMPTGRGSPVTAPTPRLSTAGGVGSSSSSASAGQSQADGLSQLFDLSTFQPNSHSSSTSGQSMFGSTSLQVAHHPPAPPTPPLQNSAPAQSGARLFPGPLPLASSSLPASLAALPPMSHYQQFLATIPSNMAVPESTKKTRAAFALESAAYGIPKHRSRGMSSGPVASSSFGTSSTRGFDAAAASSDTDMNLAIQVGEDAYFLLPSALGVSDGVGGWSQKGRSQGQTQPSSQTGPSASAQFSRRLMHFCADEISALGPLPEAWPTSSPSSPPAGNLSHSPATVPAQAGVLNQASAANTAGPDPQTSDLLEPVAVLQRAYARALALSRADHSLCGSSTAMLAILLGDELRVAHLGDCAVCLVRNGQMVFRSEEQQWKFNHPLQLGPFSSTVPGDAQRIALKVQPDDILILSSDGMSDNLWDEDVLDEVQKFTRERGDATGAAAIIRKHAMPSMLSEALCSRAKRASEARPHRSRDDSALPFPSTENDVAGEVPFARRAREEGIKFSGGKQDDISVLVAVIAAHEDAPSATDKTTTARSAGGSFLSSSASGSSPPTPRHSLSSGPPGTNFTFRTAWSTQ